MELANTQKSRFPFTPFANGWFRVAYSDELHPGQVKPLYYFGKDLVLFRTDNGTSTRRLETSTFEEKLARKFRIAHKQTRAFKKFTAVKYVHYWVLMYK